MRRLPSWLWLCAVAPLTLGACVVGPKYQKPVLEPPPAYKEWKAAEPGDDTLRGAWWQLFGDPQLSALEDQVSAVVLDRDLCRLGTVFWDEACPCPVGRCCFIVPVVGRVVVGRRTEAHEIRSPKSDLTLSP